MEAERRVGVAVDFSDCSRKALKWAVDNVARGGDHLILVTVLPEGHYEEGEMQLWETTGSPFIPLSEFSDPGILKKYGVKPDPETLDILTTAASQKEIVVLLKIYWGDAREKICEAIDKIPLNCLIIGNRGLGRLRRVILGSVSNYVVNNGSCPVTVEWRTLAAPPIILVLTLLFSVALLCPAAAARNVGLDETSNPQLQAACHNTSYPTVCVSTLAATLDNNASLADPTTIFQASLKATLTEVEAAIARLDKMIGAETDAFDKSCLTTCKTEYGSAAQAVKKAMSDRTYDEFSKTLNSCTGYISSCGDGFGENRANKATHINDLVLNVIDNALFLAQAAKWE
ncbi:hypothetical protein SAY87_011900 [Trapa incisa]|uniref:Pectinesterase inhibitor domain-containing protein n=1 Tax=Trapa incisa TaxID=236973 RepID=A0AAN7GJ75_9MYRT|nr:hypothetical protein SAY87_011900 [Trapa incisa]